MREVYPQRELQDALSSIDRAFSKVRLGDGVSLHQARAMDDWETRSNSQAFRAKDQELHWADISDAKLREFGNTLPFMDAEGFRFYLPRFMVYSLNHAGDGDGAYAVAAPVYACQFLDDLKAHALAKYALLTDEQRSVIARFLRLVSTYDENLSDAASAALDSYWNQYA